MCFPAHLHYLQSSFEATCKNCLKNFQNMARQAHSMCSACGPCRSSTILVCPFQLRIFPDSINLQAQQLQPGTYSQSSTGPKPSAPLPDHHEGCSSTKVTKSCLSHTFLVHFTFSWQLNEPLTPPQPLTKSAVPFPKYFW